MSKYNKTGDKCGRCPDGTYVAIARYHCTREEQDFIVSPTENRERDMNKDRCEDCPKQVEEKPKPVVTVEFGPCTYREGEVSYRNGSGFQSIEKLEAEREVLMEKLRNYKRFAKQHGWRQLGEEK